jgi:hypothetical protein
VTRTYDLFDIKASGALYVRKVATAIDPNMYRILPVDDNNDIPPITWPKEVRLSPVPDWKKRVAEFKKKHAAKRKETKADGDTVEVEIKEDAAARPVDPTAIGDSPQRVEKEVKVEERNRKEETTDDESSSSE